MLVVSIRAFVCLSVSDDDDDDNNVIHDNDDDNDDEQSCSRVYATIWPPLSKLCP